MYSSNWYPQATAWRQRSSSGKGVGTPWVMSTQHRCHLPIVFPASLEPAVAVGGATTASLSEFRPFLKESQSIEGRLIFQTQLFWALLFTSAVRQQRRKDDKAGYPTVQPSPLPNPLKYAPHHPEPRALTVTSHQYQFRPTGLVGKGQVGRSGFSSFFLCTGDPIFGLLTSRLTGLLTGRPGQKKNSPSIGIKSISLA